MHEVVALAGVPRFPGLRPLNACREVDSDDFGAEARQRRCKPAIAAAGVEDQRAAQRFPIDGERVKEFVLSQHAVVFEPGFFAFGLARPLQPEAFVAARVEDHRVCSARRRCCGFAPCQLPDHLAVTAEKRLLLDAPSQAWHRTDNGVNRTA